MPKKTESRHSTLYWLGQSRSKLSGVVGVEPTDFLTKNSLQQCSANVKRLAVRSDQPNRHTNVCNYQHCSSNSCHKHTCHAETSSPRQSFLHGLTGESVHYGPANQANSAFHHSKVCKLVLHIHGLGGRGWTPSNNNPGLRMAVVAGQSLWARAWTAHPIACTPTLSVIQKRRCSWGMRLVTLYKCHMPFPLARSYVNGVIRPT